MLWSLLCLTSSKWVLNQTILPSVDNFGIFGRSVGVNEDRVIVGASWETVGSDDRIGCIYVFEWDVNLNKYVEAQKLTPYSPSDKSVILNNTGSTVKISKDGKRIVAGAPYSTVKGHPEVGAVVVFDYDEDKRRYVQTKIIIPVENPTEADDYQGFGRSLTITSDGKTIASGYYNKPKVVKYVDDRGAVFVATETTSGWTTPPYRIDPPVTDGKRFKFGSDLQFVDNSHLIIAVELFDTYFGLGSCYYTRESGNTWTLKQKILPDGIEDGHYQSNTIESYGNKIGMPDQNTFTALVTYTKDFNPNGAFFIISYSNGKWNTHDYQALPFPPGVKLSGILFCGESTFMTHASNITDARDPSKDPTDAVLIFRRNSQGKFELSAKETLYPEPNPPEHLNFASDFAWGHDCNSIIIGGMTKYPHDDKHPEWNDRPLNYSRAYVYRNIEDPDEKPANKAAIIIVSLLACCIIVGIIGVVVYCARKHKGMIKIESRYGSKINDLET